MSYVKVIVVVLITACAMPAWAGRGRDFRANDGYTGRDEQNVVRDDARQRNENDGALSPERNEGFGYGFERRQQQMERRGNFGQRGRN